MPSSDEAVTCAICPAGTASAVAAVTGAARPPAPSDTAAGVVPVSRYGSTAFFHGAPGPVWVNSRYSVPVIFAGAASSALATWTTNQRG